MSNNYEMYVKCKKCNQKYLIPDEQIRDKKSYFQCDVCNSRVVVDNRNLLESHDQVITNNRISAKDILDGIYLSFNLKNILISFFTLLFLITFSIVLWEIYSANIRTFLEYRVLSLVGFSFAILFVIFSFNFHLYLISKNTFSNIKVKRNVIFSHIRPIILRDLSPMFWISAGIILMIVLIILPMRVSDTYSLIHTGLFFPILVILGSMLIILLGSNNLVYAYIASKSATAFAAIKNFFKFIKIENINIPIYLFLIYMVSIMIFALLFFMVGSVVSVLISVIKNFICFNIMVIICDMQRIILSGRFIEIFSFCDHCSLELKIGLGLFFFSITLITLYLFAYYVNLLQSLATVSVHIMRSNPGKSVSRVVILAVLFFFFIFVTIINFIPSFFPMILNFNPQ